MLEITDTPQIFLGPFRFGFDQARSRACLANLEVGDEVSVFRIPDTAEVDAVVEKLLNAGFATVIKLPLRDMNAKARIEAEWPHSSHIFCCCLSISNGSISASAPRDASSFARGRAGSPEGANASLQARGGRQPRN